MIPLWKWAGDIFEKALEKSFKTHSFFTYGT